MLMQRCGDRLLTLTDVYIIGGGPAGLAAAIAVSARGLRAAVADCRRPPIDKTCGEGVMPDGVNALAALGVTLDPERRVPFRGIRFLGAGACVDASFPSGPGLALRRTALHGALVRRAEEAGVSITWGAHVEGLDKEGVIVDGRVQRCRWIIGADGENSRVRRWAGLDSQWYERRRFAFRRHYPVGPWSDCVEVYWAEGYQIYITPVKRTEVCVAVISGNPRFRLDHALAGLPEIGRRLEGFAPCTEERGAISVTRRLRRVSRGAVALVG
jgi:flavin-dependent dehydrogenase